MSGFRKTTCTFTEADAERKDQMNAERQARGDKKYSYEDLMIKGLEEAEKELEA